MIRSGASGLPYYRTPLVYVPDVIGGLAVWRHHNNKSKGPPVKMGLGISRTNTDSQWNPGYNAFHRVFCGENETIRW